ncbi:MAG: hypothetical protein NT069_04115 [Planctomycetota bacterium]|nr:hypothetical protein [Planctomycetota bacterium]
MNDDPIEVVPEPEAPPTTETPNLQGGQLVLVVVGLVAFLGSFVVEFLTEDPAYFYILLPVSVISFIVVAIQVSSLSGGLSVALGLNEPGLKGRENFRTVQTLIIVCCYGIAVAIALPTLIVGLFLLAWANESFPPKFFADSNPGLSTAIRYLTAGGIGFWVWRSWPKWKHLSSNLGKSLRGRAATRFSPLWVSWLYHDEAKPSPNSELPIETQRLLEFASLLGIAVICGFFATRRNYADAVLNATAEHLERGMLLKLFYAISKRTVGGRVPGTTISWDCIAGPAALGFLAYRIANSLAVKYSIPIAVITFAASVLGFLVLSSFRW